MKIKKHMLYIGVLAIITLIFLHSWINLEEHTLGDLIVHFYPIVLDWKDSVELYNDPNHLWTESRWAGSPFLAKSEYTASLQVLSWWFIMHSFNVSINVILNDYYWFYLLIEIFRTVFILGILWVLFFKPSWLFDSGKEVPPELQFDDGTCWFKGRFPCACTYCEVKM